MINKVKEILMPKCHSALVPSKKAFSLAEVLITLGIIGIVATMTIPTLINKYNERNNQIKFRKAYNIIVNAIKLSEIENGSYTLWDTSLSATNYIKKYLLPYFKNARTCNSYENCGYDKIYPFLKADGSAITTIVAREDLRIPIILPDGIYISFSKAAGGLTGGIEPSQLIIVDLNGPKGPNTFDKDVWLLTLEENGIILSDAAKKMFGY